jgi:hypothetical protein
MPWVEDGEPGFGRETLRMVLDHFVAARSLPDQILPALQHSPGGNAHTDDFVQFGRGNGRALERSGHLADDTGVDARREYPGAGGARRLQQPFAEHPGQFGLQSVEERWKNERGFLRGDLSRKIQNKLNIQ